MDETALIINRVLPIFLLIGLGAWIRRTGFLPESTVDDLRKIVVNIALPAVLFVSFLQTELQPNYLIIFVALFALCVVLYGIGVALKPRLAPDRPYFPFMMTGFEYGMLGVSLFGSAYGLENLGYIAIMDLGHELFIWFVFLALLLARRDGASSPVTLVTSFLRSPVIIAILAAIALNLLGLREPLYTSAITGGLMATLEFLSNLTIPLILIIVGYGIKFDREGIGQAARVIVVRLAILIPVALALNALLIRGALGLGFPFEAALFTLLILPPPFIVPLYMPAGIPSDRQYVNNVLTLYTVVSLLIFAVFFVLNPTL
jgi:malate permease and related proteins